MDLYQFWVERRREGHLNYYSGAIHVRWQDDRDGTGGAGELNPIGIEARDLDVDCIELIDYRDTCWSCGGGIEEYCLDR